MTSQKTEFGTAMRVIKDSNLRQHMMTPVNSLAKARNSQPAQLNNSTNVQNSADKEHVLQPWIE